MSKRWPLHPLPCTNESLLSWIVRIASVYHMYPEDLLKYEFGIELELHNLYLVDLNPSVNLLQTLSEFTGVEFDTVRALTAQVYVPLLIDTLEMTEINSSNDYVNQFHIFPDQRNNIVDFGNGVAPWLNTKRFANPHGCIVCLNSDHEPYLRLYWRFPWMMTCPIHKLLLKQIVLYGSWSGRTNFYCVSTDSPATSHSLDDLCIIDNITLQAVTTGKAEVPSRSLHGGIWLRVLRTIIEALNSLIKTIGNKRRNLLTPFWREFNLFNRQGLGRYTFFEECDANKQLTLMLVAASVLKSIFSGKVEFSSSVVRLLAPPLIYEKDFDSIYPSQVEQKP